MADLIAPVCSVLIQGLLHLLCLTLLPELILPTFSQLPPKFLPTQTNVTVMVGQLAKLPCRVKNVGSKDVVWRHEGSDRFLTIGKLTWVKDPDIIVEHQRLSMEIGDWNLLIKNAQKERTGMYECQITATKKYVQEVYLRVIDPPANKPDIYLQGSKYVPVGGEIRLLCNISGRLGARGIDWFKDGDKVDNERYRNYIITRFWTVEDRSLYSELIVDNSQPWDSGTYLCRGSENEITSQEVTVRVGEFTGGSSNVKREYGPEREQEQLQTQSHYNSGQLHTEKSQPDTSSAPVTSLAIWPLILTTCVSALLANQRRT